ncbi:MAG: peptidoglycan DD-metalloendopeptidase family protein [Rhodanobacteraceae bacterium]
MTYRLLLAASCAIAIVLLTACATTPAPVVDRSLNGNAPPTQTSSVQTQPNANGARGEHANGVQTAQGYRVAPGDTLYSIAFRHGMDFRALAARNGIAPPYTIHPGQVLRLDNGEANRVATMTTTTTRQAMVPRTSATATGTTHQQAPVFGPVESTPPSVSAPVANHTETASAASSGVTTLPTITLPPGRTPPGSRQVITTTMTVANPPLAANQIPSATNPSPTPTNPQQTPVVTSPPLSSVAAGRIRNVDGINWQWPADGAVISGYQADSGAGAGLDIAGKAGDPVRAAADGTVVYSGNGLIGYGELIIIKHSDNYLSAYGHNRKRLVKEGERVRAGQEIAEMGSSGAPREELHFEIRQAGKPVDPTDYLPGR